MESYPEVFRILRVEGSVVKLEPFEEGEEVQLSANFVDCTTPDPLGDEVPVSTSKSAKKTRAAVKVATGKKRKLYSSDEEEGVKSGCKVKESLKKKLKVIERRSVTPSTPKPPDPVVVPGREVVYPLTPLGKKTKDGPVWLMPVPESRNDPDPPQPPETAPIIHEMKDPVKTEPEINEDDDEEPFGRISIVSITSLASPEPSPLKVSELSNLCQPLSSQSPLIVLPPAPVPSPPPCPPASEDFARAVNHVQHNGVPNLTYDQFYSPVLNPSLQEGLDNFQPQHTNSPGPSAILNFGERPPAHSEVLSCGRLIPLKMLEGFNEDLAGTSTIKYQLKKQVYVTNLFWNCNAKCVYAIFKPFGIIRNIQCGRRGLTNESHAVVTFSQKVEACRAQNVTTKFQRKPLGHAVSVTHVLPTATSGTACVPTLPPNDMDLPVPRDPRHPHRRTSGGEATMYPISTPNNQKNQPNLKQSKSKPLKRKPNKKKSKFNANLVEPDPNAHSSLWSRNNKPSNTASLDPVWFFRNK